MNFIPRFLRRGLWGLLLGMVGAAQAETPVVPGTITTGAVRALISAEIPPAPPGFKSTLETFAAIPAGKLEGVNITAPIPGTRIERNIVYARYGEDEVTLDLYSPDRVEGTTPGIVLIHGGAWVGGRKEDYSYYGSKFAQWGYVAVSINYRKAPQHRFPACVQDSKAAVRWLRANAERYQVDPERIGVVGGSAGGHLALMVGYVQGLDELEGDGGHGEFSSRVRTVVAIYPPTDLSTITPRIMTESAVPSPLLVSFLGGTFQQIPEVYRKASPLTHLTPDDPPTLILHGTIDSLVPVSQSDQLAEKLAELEIPYVYDRLPGWPHAMDLTRPVNDRCLFFMKHFLESTLRHDLSRSGAVP